MKPEVVNAIDIQIDAVRYENTFAQDVQINTSDIDREFCEQSGKFAYYGTLCEMSKDREARLKNDCDVLEAILDNEVRDQAAEVKVLDAKYKITEAEVAHRVKADPRYQAKYSEYLTAKKLTGILHVAKEAFQQRKDMLVSLGANQRFLNAEPRIQGTQMENVKKR
jgi:hypothetical protein